LGQSETPALIAGDSGCVGVVVVLRQGAGRSAEFSSCTPVFSAEDGLFTSKVTALDCPLCAEGSGEDGTLGQSEVLALVVGMFGRGRVFVAAGRDVAFPSCGPLFSAEDGLFTSEVTALDCPLRAEGSGEDGTLGQSEVLALVVGMFGRGRVFVAAGRDVAFLSCEPLFSAGAGLFGLVVVVQGGPCCVGWNGEDGTSR